MSNLFELKTKNWIQMNSKKPKFHKWITENNKISKDDKIQRLFVIYSFFINKILFSSFITLIGWVSKSWLSYCDVWLVAKDMSKVQSNAPSTISPNSNNKSSIPTITLQKNYPTAVVTGDITMWYPTLESTLMCLSKLYLCIDVCITCMIIFIHKEFPFF
jgi:hypothetical protein